MMTANVPLSRTPAGRGSILCESGLIHVVSLYLITRKGLQGVTVQNTKTMIKWHEGGFNVSSFRTPLNETKCDFNKVANSLALRHGCSPVNLLHIFRTSFFQNTFGRLLLKVTSLRFTFSIRVFS